MHCEKGRDRVGYMVAAYRIIVQDWTADDAIHEMFDFHFNTIFFETPIFLRALDKEISGCVSNARHSRSFYVADLGP